MRGKIDEDARVMVGKFMVKALDDFFADALRIVMNEREQAESNPRTSTPLAASNTATVGTPANDPRVFARWRPLNLAETS